MSGTVITGGLNGPLAGGAAFIPVPIKNSAYTANPGDFVPVDVSGGAVTVTLPAAPADQSAITVMMINQANANAVTVVTSGTDVINVQGGPASWSMPMLYQRAVFQYVRALGVWYVVNDGLPLTQGKVQGPLVFANQAVAPAAPAGAAVVYASGGVLTYINPQGLVNTIVGSQGGLTAAAAAITNTTSETVLQSMSLPANDAIASAVYKMVGWGVFTSAAAPGNTLFTLRLGGVAGTVLATSSNISLPVGLLAAPAAPVPTTATTGGSVAAGTYQVQVTYVNATGETVASASGSVTTTGTTSTITVPSPAASGNATGWYAYVTQAGGSTYTRQQTAGSPTSIGTALTITAPPTSTGANPLTTGTANVSLTNAQWNYEARLNFLTPTSVTVDLELTINTVAGGAANEYLVASTAPVTVSLTSTKAFTVDITPGATGNSVQLLGGWSERVA